MKTKASGSKASEGRRGKLLRVGTNPQRTFPLPFARGGDYKRLSNPRAVHYNGQSSTPALETNYESRGERQSVRRRGLRTGERKAKPIREDHHLDPEGPSTIHSPLTSIVSVEVSNDAPQKKKRKVEQKEKRNFLV